MSDKETAAQRAVATSPLSHERTGEGAYGTGDRSERKRVRGSVEFSSREGPHRNPPKKKLVPEKILSAFSARAFRREQPDDPHLMLQFIARAIAFNEPIPFVMYWGKGPRTAIARPDVECIDFMSAMIERVREVYPLGARLKLIFTDTHAALNGHSEPDIRSYFAEIDACARARGFDTCRLGDLVRAAGSEVGPIDDEMPMGIAERLAQSAKKWYHGEGTVEEGALKYYRANMLERRVVELAFPHSIMITFNGSVLRSLLPLHLPVFYMYSLRRGFSVKPWFILPDSTS